MNLCPKLRLNRQTVNVEAVWAAEVLPLKSAPYSRKFREDQNRTGLVEDAIR